MIFDRLLSIIAPYECLSCAKEGELLCADCAQKLPRIPSRCYRCGCLTKDYQTCPACRRQSALFGVYAATTYQGLAKQLVHLTKFERAKGGAQSMAQAMQVDWQLPLGSLVTFAPTAQRRVRARGYDQAAVMARAVACNQELSCTRLLARVDSRRQVGLGRQERLQQMKGAFEPLRPALIQNKTILLIDDVITTGATLESAARTLKIAGAKRVYAAVFAAA